MGQTFTDRYGQLHTPPGEMPIVGRQGAGLFWPYGRSLRGELALK